MQLTSQDQEGAVRRFSDALDLAAQEWRDSGRPILIALSGGADSSALAWLAANSFPGRASAMTVDHGLRPEAAEEALICAGLCARLGIAHSIATPDRPIKGNLQAEARKARYTLLAREADRLGGALILTAHHADDQLETMLMRLARGSGVAGLSGIRHRNGDIVRPLLGFSRRELEEICRSADIDWVRDPSNEDRDFDRVRMRHALARTELPIEPHAIARTAKALSDAEQALAFVTQKLAAERIAHDGGLWRLDASGLPHELTRRLVLTLLDRAGQAAPRGDALDRLIAKLESGGRLSVGQMVATGGKKWSFALSPPRRSKGQGLQ